MFTSNPFAELTTIISPLFMQIYVVLAVIAVIAGTLLDVYHKGSAQFFEQRRRKAEAEAHWRVGGGKKAALAVKSAAEAAVSGEFCKWDRRVSHLLMLYGFLLYIVTTAIMVYGYPGDIHAPVLTALWDIGALMVVVGGLWFFLLLRVNVAYEGESPLHLGYADLFIGSLILSAGFALIWHFVQSVTGNGIARMIFFALYIASTTLLFVSIYWSKFAHMFYKPVVAYERHVEEENGSTDLPVPRRMPGYVPEASARR